jgi:hypothetical protein
VAAGIGPVSRAVGGHLHGSKRAYKKSIST